MQSSITRRAFMNNGIQTLAGAAVAATLDPAQAQAQQLPICDPHLHLWDLTKFRLPWIDKDNPLGKSFVMKDYLEATQGLNVVKAVYMEVDVEAKQQTEEANYVFDICKQNDTPMKAAVISGRPASDDFAKYLDQFKGNQFLKGVRQVLHTPTTPAGFCLTPAFARGLRALDERGLSFDLCIRPAEAGDFVKLVESMPNLRFILDHCGNGPVYGDRAQWQRDIDRLARSKNVVAKISGIVVQAREKWTPEDLAPVINHTMNAFGPDRVMFAGDWPVCTLKASYRQWVDALKTIVRDRPLEEQRKLFHDNAVRFYGI